MRSPSAATAGVVLGVGLSLTTAAAGALGAPRLVWMLIGGAGVLCFIVAIWMYLARDRQPSEEAKHHLKRLLRVGVEIRGNLTLADDPNPFPNEDRVYRWARETWEALQRENPRAARAFFGEKTPYSRAHFKTAYTIEVDRAGRRAYLDTRIPILDEAVRALSPI